MRGKKKVKTIIVILSVLAFGFIGFQVLKRQSPDIERTHQIIKTVQLEDRKITKSPFVQSTPETGTETQQEEENIDSPDVKKMLVPDTVPTAQSSDTEIREFQAWLSSIPTEEDTLEGLAQEDSNTEAAENDEIDYELETLLIETLIEDQWKNSIETYDIEGYMSAIWEDNFFYVSDMGTPDNQDDDLIFRSGQQEQDGILNMFNTLDSIELNLYRSGNIEFLSDTHVMVDYDYDLKLFSSKHGNSYPSGRMIFILEFREGGDWRILEWYDFATPDP
ncbi:hypothetical protein F4083_01950 [Candidatus Poribacteria bacterium]|nr:hypothetical protein [Candidatus Poribacteria bacterium]MYB65203.1 hypothetical protein [Candidatus Poribacteria bacterium]MYF56300.1 hypothetical protein [Candidatus Poribacteria bacterium]MYI93075.1 hypothetical protein [Candidatus Poribacteria bacterium]